MSEKRAFSQEDGALSVAKRQRTDTQLVASTTGPKPTQPGIRRTSGLLAPIMQLAGHSSEVLGARFSPDGTVIASCSHDKTIFLWRTYGECENFMVLKGHNNAILELHWFQTGEQLVTASADRTLRGWDAEVGKQIKKVTEHTNIVNSVHPLRRGPPLFVSGSDDTTVKVWDMRVKRSVATLQAKFPVTSVAFADAGDQVYSGGVENAVHVWDLRKQASAMVLKGHSDTITSLRNSPDGTHLLTNAMDNTLRVWDMRPYAPANRCVKVFTGHMHNFEKNLIRCDWSPDGACVAAGSADRMVVVWEAATRRILYKLPGHNGCVNDVAFHPTEPIIVSASSDKTLFLGELDLAPAMAV